MFEPYEVKQYRGYTIEVHVDEDAETPREFDNLWTLATLDHRGGFSGDCKVSEFAVHWEESDESIVDRLLKNPGGRLVVPLGQYGDNIVVEDNYNRIRGLAILDKSKIFDEYGWKRVTAERRAKLESYLQGELDVLNSWRNGEVYGYVVKDQSDEVLDSCWGYYGEDKYATGEAESFIDYRVKNETEAAWSKIDSVVFAD